MNGVTLEACSRETVNNRFLKAFEGTGGSIASMCVGPSADAGECT